MASLGAKANSAAVGLWPSYARGGLWLHSRAVPVLSHEAKFLANPFALSPWSKTSEGKRRLRVVVETGRGGRNQLAFDPGLGTFRLENVLPEGLSFPYDLGFVPSTRADDGGPLGVVVLMDEPAVTGVVVECQPIGVVQGERHRGKKWVRDDRLVAVAIPSHRFGDLQHIDDLAPGVLGELDRFFVAAHAAGDARFRVVGSKGPGKSWRVIERAARSWRKRSD